jgi:beta-glucosidase
MRLTIIRFLLVLAPCLASAKSPAWLTARDAEIRSLLDRMTIEEKVGQMTQPELGALKHPDDIKTLFLGSVLSGGGSDPQSGNTLADWSETYRDCQSRALGTRLRIPLLYGIDAVHGHNNVLGAVIFPHNIGLGCTRDPGLVERVARITAREMRATGIQWTFAPCVAVPRDIRWGRTYEGYSEDPAIVTALGVAALRGLQGTSPGGPDSVLGCVKHFVADGGTAFGSASSKGLLDQGDARIGEDSLRSIHMAGYPAAIDAGAVTVMPSYSSWNGVKCSGSHRLLTTILKQELGFEGFVISDYNAIDQLVAPKTGDAALPSNSASGQIEPADYKKCVEIAINAGMDMVMVTDKYRDFIRALIELVHENKVPMARIDDAVTRILRAKHAQGLMEKDAPLMPNTAFQNDFGSEKHRAVARDAVRRSIVLLKNEDGVLPLSRKGRIHVAGRAADDLGMQCGGWTIDWQGRRGEVTPGGTTILKALQQSVGKDASITVSKDGSTAEGSDAVVVVIGEEPYAEMEGDREDLALASEDIAAVAAAKAAGVPVIVVILSGRPLVLGAVADQADAILAAWLPGTEGGGVADLLLGDASPSGKLSFAWPRSMAQVPLGHNPTPPGDVLFPLGHGLAY